MRFRIGIRALGMAASMALLLVGFTGSPAAAGRPTTAEPAAPSGAVPLDASGCTLGFLCGKVTNGCATTIYILVNVHWPNFDSGHVKILYPCESSTEIGIRMRMDSGSSRRPTPLSG